MTWNNKGNEICELIPASRLNTALRESVSSFPFAGLSLKIPLSAPKNSMRACQLGFSFVFTLSGTLHKLFLSNSECELRCRKVDYSLKTQHCFLLVLRFLYKYSWEVSAQKLFLEPVHLLPNVPKRRERRVYSHVSDTAAHNDNTCLLLLIRYDVDHVHNVILEC